MNLRQRITLLGSTALIGALVLSGCSATPESPQSAAPAATISVKANNGSVTVPVKPTKVVALDNTSFETLHAWGVTPVALPKGLLPHTGFEDWAQNKDIVDLGTHREPDLEALSAVDTDLIIGGYRFGDYTDEITAMNIAPVIDLAGNEKADGGWVGSLKTQTTNLGDIFDKKDEAKALVADLEKAEADAKKSTNGETVFLAVASGGKIDNGASRLSRILEPLNLTDVFAGEAGDIHGDSGLAPETIAQANPDWMIVMDRDAAVSTEGASPAKQIVEAQEAFAETTFAKKKHIIYLDPNFYIREGIQSYTQVYQQVADAFSAS